jgi:peroxisomal membrane protein 4
MIFLFRSGTLQEKLTLIFKATRTHARNLAKYAMIYKATMMMLKHVGATPGKEGMILLPTLELLRWLSYVHEVGS